MRAVASRIVSTAAVLTFGLIAGSDPVQAGERWQWSLTPYLWATDVQEDVTLKDRVVSDTDTEFKDLVDKLDSSLQLHFEGLHQRWGLFADLSFVELTDSKTGEAGLLRFDVEIEETVLEAGAIFRPGGPGSKLDLLFGARQLSVDEDYRLQLAELDPLEASIDEDYLDALIGLRYHIPLSERWIVSLRGDLSAGGTDYMWTAQGLLGWRFGARRGSGIFVGYRHREMEFEKDGRFEVDKTLSGFGLGVKIGF